MVSPGGTYFSLRSGFAVQTAVGVDSDGRPGTNTWKAIYQRVSPGKDLPEEATEEMDSRSERVIARLLPRALLR